jgi:hypothetical protein
VDESVYIAIRAALLLAVEEKHSVVVTLRPSAPTPGKPDRRQYEGIPTEIVMGPDGRERLFLGVADDTSHVILLDRIGRVERTNG